MKPIFEEFICPICGRAKNLKTNNGICIDCRDEQIIIEIHNNTTDNLATSAQ